MSYTEINYVFDSHPLKKKKKHLRDIASVQQLRYIFFCHLAKLQLFAERTGTSSTDSSGSHVASTRESFLQRPRHPAPSAPKNKGQTLLRALQRVCFM